MFRGADSMEKFRWALREADARGQRRDALRGFIRSTYSQAEPFVYVPPPDDGWVAMLVPDEQIAEAKREMEEDRAERGTAGWFDGGDGWEGNVGEYAARDWLRDEHGLPVIRYGRVNDKPDLEIGGRITVDVKTRKKIFQPLMLIVLDEHLHKPWDWFLFAGWDGRCAQLVGAMPCGLFRQVAVQGRTEAMRRAHPDLKVEPWYVMADDQRLTSPRAFVEAVKSALK